jgi:hypothetical protein
MKFAEPVDTLIPRKAARRLVEIASTIEPVQDGRHPHREDQRALPVPGQGQRRRIRRSLKLAIKRGWLVMHESGMFLRSRRLVRSWSREGSSRLFPVV